MYKLIVLLLPLLPFNTVGQETIQVGEVNNKIELGPFAGSRDLAFGVQSILEEVLQDKGYNLSYKSDIQVQVDLLYFDVQKTNLQIVIYSKNTDEYQIIARATLIKNGKKFSAWRSCYYYGVLGQQLLYVPIDRGEEIYLATILSVMVGNKLHIGEKGGVEERKLHT